MKPPAKPKTTSLRLRIPIREAMALKKHLMSARYIWKKDCEDRNVDCNRLPRALSAAMKEARK